MSSGCLLITTKPAVCPHTQHTQVDALFTLQTANIHSRLWSKWATRNRDISHERRKCGHSAPTQQSFPPPQPAGGWRGNINVHCVRNMRASALDG